MELAEMNAYVGYRFFTIDLLYGSTVMIGIILVYMLTPARIKAPSDFLHLFYGIFVLLPYVVLYPIRGLIEFEDILFNFTILAFPLLLIRLVTLSVPAIQIPELFNEEYLLRFIIVISVVGLVFAVMYAPTSAGFGVLDSYDRRIEGRSVYQAGTLLAYLVGAIANGFAPFIAFWGGWRSKLQLLGFSLFCAVALFYILGMKAPIGYIALAWIIGYAVRIGRVQALVGYIFTLLLMVFAMFLIEHLLFGYSIVGDYFIRRAFSVPPYVLSAYFEFMSPSSGHYWSILEGVSDSRYITYVIGEDVLGLPDANANTNAFVVKLAANGIFMYLLAVMLVATIFTLLDKVYRLNGNSLLLYVGFSYSILLIEQAATTALVSSGMGLLILFTIFSKTESQNISQFTDAVQ